MRQTEPSSAKVTLPMTTVTPNPQTADATIEHRYPSDIDRLREVVGVDVLPFYRDEQAIVANRQARERWPHLVAFADSRGAASTLSAASAATTVAPRCSAR
ncbi:hypothetical protein DBA34_13470 [Pandoraea cepalis]|nr:hypothetical protein [Pandoraea cepalis]